MVFIVFITYLVVCYLLASVIFRSKTDVKSNQKKKLITTFLLALVGVAGLIYWDYSSKRCKTCERAIQVSEVVGKWKTESKIIEMRSDGSYQSEWLDNPSLTSNGTFTVDGALIKFIDTKYKSSSVTFEICEITKDKMYYHDFSLSLAYTSGDKEMKETATRLK